MLPQYERHEFNSISSRTISLFFRRVVSCPVQPQPCIGVLFDTAWNECAGSWWCCLSMKIMSSIPHCPWLFRGFLLVTRVCPIVPENEKSTQQICVYVCLNEYSILCGVSCTTLYHSKAFLCGWHIVECALCAAISRRSLFLEMASMES